MVATASYSRSGIWSASCSISKSFKLNTETLFSSESECVSECECECECYAE